MTFCNSCGKELKPDTRFCEHCGAPVPIAAQEETPEKAAFSEPVQGSYTPPAQPAQGSYTPPAQQLQGSYVPPAQAAQGSYSQPQQQGGYTPPTQQQQGGYTPPVQQGYAPQAAYAQSPMQKQKKPINKKIFLFGGIGLAALVLIIVIIY